MRSQVATLSTSLYPFITEYARKPAERIGAAHLSTNDGRELLTFFARSIIVHDCRYHWQNMQLHMFEYHLCAHQTLAQSTRSIVLTFHIFNFESRALEVWVFVPSGGFIVDFKEVRGWDALSWAKYALSKNRINCLKESCQ